MILDAADMNVRATTKFDAEDCTAGWVAFFGIGVRG
jgi:hypothetical protein